MHTFIASNASAIYQGSAVKAVNGGSIAIGSATGDTVAFVGVFAGCEYVSSSQGKKKVFSNFWPGSGVGQTQTFRYYRICVRQPAPAFL